VADPFEYSNEPSTAIKGGEFLDCRSDYQLLKSDFLSWILLLHNNIKLGVLL